VVSDQEWIFRREKKRGREGGKYKEESEEEKEYRVVKE